MQRREELTARIRAKLAGDPEKLAHFEKLFEAAKYSYPLTEDHAFYIDQMGVVLFRRFVSAVGERLARRGCFDNGEDIYFLYDAEVGDAMANDTDYHALVAERKAEYEACAQASPPTSWAPRPRRPSRATSSTRCSTPWAAACSASSRPPRGSRIPT